MTVNYVRFGAPAEALGPARSGDYRAAVDPVRSRGYRHSGQTARSLGEPRGGDIFVGPHRTVAHNWTGLSAPRLPCTSSGDGVVVIMLSTRSASRQVLG